MVGTEIPLPARLQWWLNLRRRLKWGAAALTVLALVTAVLILIPTFACGNINPFAGLRDQGGECVGVTDGGYVFHPSFREIQGDINRENDWVADQHAQGRPAVKVALLTTLSVDDDSSLPPGVVRHVLEGAHVAQWRANRTRDLGAKQPLIQLYLANEGSLQQGWEIAVDRVIGMTDDEIPLTIVMGQSTSTKYTIAAANRLSDAKIPMVTAATTADTLDYAHIPGLIRAAPSNTDFAVAIRRFLDGQEQLQDGILVYDDREVDEFAVSLKEAFEEHLGKYLGSSHQRFLGNTVEEGGPDVFREITQTVCFSGVDMVFFSGRAPDFKTFVQALAQLTCRDRPHLTIIFVDLGLFPGDRQELRTYLGRDMTVLHATGYDPGWPTGDVAPPEGFQDFLKRYDHLFEGAAPEELADGYTVVAHDSMAAAVRAVRITNPRDHVPPEPQDVRENLLLLNSQEAVEGASGTLHFNANRNGHPGGKYVPIVPFPEPDDYQPSPPYITPIQ